MRSGSAPLEAGRGHLARRIGRVTAGVAVLAAIAIVAMAAALVAAADRIDRMERDHAERLVANAVKVKQEVLRSCVDNITVWDAALAHLDNRYDPAWAEANIGAFFKSNCDVQEAYVLGADGSVLGAWSDGRALAPRLPGALAPAAQNLVAAIRRQEAARGPFLRRLTHDVTIAQPIDQVAIVGRGGRPAVVLASLVQPDFGKVLPVGATAPILVVVQPMDGAWLAWLQRRYLLGRVRLTTPPWPALAAGQAATVIRDASGAPAARLAWAYGRPAQALALVVAPALGLLLLVLLFAPAATIWRERRHIRRLDAAMRQARVASEAKSRFIANMSHEIRTPMNGVLGVLHLLRRKRLDADSAQLVEEAMASAELLLGLLNDVLDLSRIEEGRLELNPTPFDPLAALAEVAGLFAAQARAKGVALETRVLGALTPVLADGLRLRQILLNLIGNAVKFTSRGRIVVTVEGAAGPGGSTLRFEVADSGVGIAPEAQPAIFQRFIQADGSTARRYGGSGLGLSISQALVGLMGGEIGFTSQAGVGSTFWFAITAPEAEVMAESAATDRDAADEQACADLSVLLVEDNPANRLVASRLLEAVGARVECAADGAEGLIAARSGRFDLILMDVQMPVMDGLAATRAIRALDGPSGRTPIIGLTADVLASQRAACLEAGMDAVAAKPIDPGALFTEIAALIGRAGASARSAA